MISASSLLAPLNSAALSGYRAHVTSQLLEFALHGLLITIALLGLGLALRSIDHYAENDEPSRLKRIFEVPILRVRPWLKAIRKFGLPIFAVTFATPIFGSMAKKDGVEAFIVMSLCAVVVYFAFLMLRKGAQAAKGRIVESYHLRSHGR